MCDFNLNVGSRFLRHISVFIPDYPLSRNRKNVSLPKNAVKNFEQIATD